MLTKINRLFSEVETFGLAVYLKGWLSCLTGYLADLCMPNPYTRVFLSNKSIYWTHLGIKKASKVNWRSKCKYFPPERTPPTQPYGEITSACIFYIYGAPNTYIDWSQLVEKKLIFDGGTYYFYCTGLNRVVEIFLLIFSEHFCIFDDSIFLALRFAGLLR